MVLSWETFQERVHTGIAEVVVCEELFQAIGIEM